MKFRGGNEKYSMVKITKASRNLCEREREREREREKERGREK